MRPAIATIISPRPWEGALAAAAAESGLVRLIARCYDAAELPLVDAVVVGSETPWAQAEVLRRWSRQGLVVIGVFPDGDEPAVEMFCRAAVDQLFIESTDPVILLRAIRDLVRARAPAR